ncbi:MAG: HAD-IB family phosphatase [Nanoarchaeota archaeon]|nr:HAD-IB family phosphatase [Nanoarchaeota archaeon]MBU4116211.1 HAD-IB family phosphatase [Nanoarchaeota archaeon]
MEIKAVLIDFDGTIVNKDILDLVCGIVEKEKESERINDEFHNGKREGLSALIERINFLGGISTKQINKKLAENDFLIKGAKEFFDFLNSKGIISILNSGNLIPILKYYQKKLGISYIVGTKPKMNGNKILSISEEDFSGSNFKLIDSKVILVRLGIKQENVIAIGDSPADKPLFDFAIKSIAINPKGGIEKNADFQIEKDLSKAIKIIKILSKTE